LGYSRGTPEKLYNLLGGLVDFDRAIEISLEYLASPCRGSRQTQQRKQRRIEERRGFCQSISAFYRGHNCIFDASLIVPNYEVSCVGLDFDSRNGSEGRSVANSA
jgi:hypothetical protein